MPALELTVAFNATAVPMVVAEGVTESVTVGVFWTETVWAVVELAA